MIHGTSRHSGRPQRSCILPVLWASSPSLLLLGQQPSKGTACLAFDPLFMVLFMVAQVEHTRGLDILEKPGHSKKGRPPKANTAQVLGVVAIDGGITCFLTAVCMA